MSGAPDNSPNDISSVLGFGEVDDKPDPRWKKPKAGDATARPIDYLVPGSKEHQVVLQYLKNRLEHSEREMSKFYARWGFNEQRMQAYINLNDYEKLLKQQNDSGKAPKAVNITVPYMWATTMTIITYMLHTFCGRKPIFQVGATNIKAQEKASSMELLLQYNADHTKLIRHLYQFFQDGEIYGLSVMAVQWTNEKARRTVWKQEQNPMMPGEANWTPTREVRTVYEGNTVKSIDPFMFFPDPRVPMTEVNERGEYVFWRTFEGKHFLKRLEAAGEIKFVDAAGQLPRGGLTVAGTSQSSRSIRTEGEATPGTGLAQTKGDTFVQLDQGTVEIIPKNLGLSETTTPEKWIFTILNKRQIVQAEPYEMDHGKHPVVVSEPYTMGYGFGQLALADLLTPLQDTISWFVNAHVDNVRAIMNNMLVVDPSRVEMQDLKAQGPGKLIRLKRASYGQDVKEAVFQLQVQDVTARHMGDLETFIRLADSLTGVGDNLRGIQDAAGRKTATEVRTSTEAGASRLAASARLRSVQAIVPLAEMMSLNNQQLLSQEFEATVLGIDNGAKSFRISPEEITGDFYFPVNDGTLPIDKIAMMDIWKELLMGIMSDQQLRMEFDVPGLFSWLAELGGARNFDRFKINLQDPEAIAQQAQAGNLVPTATAARPVPGVRGMSPRLAAGPGSATNPVQKSPGDRAQTGVLPG
jgi:hypothetical protein